MNRSLSREYQSLTLETERGDLSVRYYPAPAGRSAAIWVGGVGGGWDTPAGDLYPSLAADLTGEGIASLRVQYRRPTELDECIYDVLAGIAFLQGEGIAQVALIGHSLGGAVVIQAAAAVESVRTVVTLSTQSYGAAPAADLAPRCSILLIHGTADPILPPQCSEQVYRIAGEPKQLILYQGADHVLASAAEQVRAEVRAWLLRHLGGQPALR